MHNKISDVTALRGSWVRPSLVSLVQDVRWGLRGLRTRPGLTFVAVAMLGLGIGINGAVFTVVNAALFKGFRHVQRNDQIVQVGTTRDFICYPDFVEWRKQATSFDDLALVRGIFHTLNTGRGDPDTAFATEITTNTFRLLGVTPFLGRDFLPADADRWAPRRDWSRVVDGVAHSRSCRPCSGVSHSRGEGRSAAALSPDGAGRQFWAPGGQRRPPRTRCAGRRPAEG